MNWAAALELSKKDQEKFIDRGKKIVKRFRDERQLVSDSYSSEKKYNILWSNVRTLFPAVYAKKPKAQVERRYKDQDPIGRTASEILERALQYEIDHYPDFDAGIKGAILDRLLPGRGVVWIRYEQGAQATEGLQVTDDVRPGDDHECTPVDYVFWEDFRHSPARTWEEVTWVARRVYMTKAEGIERFGEEKFKDVPLVHEPIGLDEMKKNGTTDTEGLKKGCIWEIWDKTTKKVYWKAESFQEILDEKDDPLKLEGFFPCPKPLFSTTTTDTLVPVADYLQYQDQAMEMDELTNRIAMLVKAVKVVGVYDSSQTGIDRMLSEGVDNTLIPVSNWAMFSEKGGIKGVIDFLPLEQVVMALQQLYAAREACKQVIYEVTGLSDIIRGASVASETATAQQIKSQYASLRLKDMQIDVARFASDILRAKAQIMTSVYSDQTLVMMSGIEMTGDREHIQPALDLLRQKSLRNYRIEVAADSMVELDEQAEKQGRIEFLTAAGGFLEKAVMAGQQQPELAPLMGEMLMFGIRAFKAGRPMEAAFEQAIAKMSEPKPPKPDPEAMKLQAEAQQAQQKLQAEQAREQARAQADIAIEQARMSMEAQFEQQRMALDQQAAERQAAIDMQIEQMRMQFDAQLEQFKAIKQAETQITVAQINSEATLSAAQESAADEAAND